MGSDEPKRNALGQYLPGQSGNLSGRGRDTFAIRQRIIDMGEKAADVVDRAMDGYPPDIIDKLRELEDPRELLKAMSLIENAKREATHAALKVMEFCAPKPKDDGKQPGEEAIEGELVLEPSLRRALAAASIDDAELVTEKLSNGGAKKKGSAKRKTTSRKKKK